MVAATLRCYTGLAGGPAGRGDGGRTLKNLLRWHVMGNRRAVTSPWSDPNVPREHVIHRRWFGRRAAPARSNKIEPRGTLRSRSGRLAIPAPPASRGPIPPNNNPEVHIP